MAEEVALEAFADTDRAVMDPVLFFAHSTFIF